MVRIADMFRSRTLKRLARDMYLATKMVEHIGERLEQANWTVKVEPLIGTVRPDLIVKSPEGVTYLVEVKVGAGSAHFAALAQLANFQELIQDAGDARVKPVLVTNLDVPEAVSQAARALDISIIKAEGHPAQIADTVCAQLKQGQI